MRGGSSVLKQGTLKKKDMNPIWRGVGCLVIGIFLIGGYFVSGLLINWLAANPLPGVPNLQNFGTSLSPLTIPGTGVTIPAISINYVQWMLTLVVALIGYSIMAIVYAIVNPPKLNPHDAPPIHRKIDKSKVR